MIYLRIITPESERTIESLTGYSLLDILRQENYKLYAPCGGKGTCGKCLVMIKDEGEVISCEYYPEKNIEVILPGEEESNILVHQTEFLCDYPFKSNLINISSKPYGVAIDIGTTTVVLYFMNLLTGQIEKISFFLNPQKIYGSDVITRINYCQEHKNGLAELQKSIIDAVNKDFDIFIKEKQLVSENIERIVVAGNTTMLHLLLGEDPITIALAPFKPVFIDKQIINGHSAGFNISRDAIVVTLPGISAFVGSDIVAGLAALKVNSKNYLFLDIGTNGGMALITGDRIATCSTAAGPAFEGANISCGMGAVNGAISAFSGTDDYQVIGNREPIGICGSGLVDIAAYMLTNNIIDETGLLKETFIINGRNKILVTQQDIREIQLAKSAIYSGIIILLNRADMTYHDIDALYLAGGFGNYINIDSAIQIGLLPDELREKIYPIGNSSVIGALQYLKTDEFAVKIDSIINNSEYIELSDVDEFTLEFALNMDFKKCNYENFSAH
jgi:uncharacterized 2Fe-2S/4Fe-4S cluster protein (DUF4445 family)